MKADRLAELGDLLRELGEIYDFWSEIAISPIGQRAKGEPKFDPPPGFRVDFFNDPDYAEVGENEDPDEFEKAVFPTADNEGSVDPVRVAHQALISAYRRRANAIVRILELADIKDLPEPPKDFNDDD